MYWYKMEKTIFSIIVIVLLSACSQSTWTEGFEHYGIKDGYQTNISYKTGGYTKLVISVSSEMYKELTFPVTLNVSIDNTTCTSETVAKATQKLLVSATCEKELGPGNHTLTAYLVSPDNFKNIAIEDDREKNYYHGLITYTLEE